MYRKGLQGIVLYFLSMVMLLAVFWWLASNLLSKYFFMGPWAIIVLALVPLAVIFLYIPSLPRTYRYQFKGKIRQDIPEEELESLLLELTYKSLELAAIVIFVISALCVLVYAVAQYLAAPGAITLALEAAAVFNMFLISLVAVSNGGYNKKLLRRTFTEEGYWLYTSRGNYRRIVTILLAFDALIGIFILYGLSSRLTIELAVILLIAIVDNVVLAISLWNYLKIKGEHQAGLSQMKLSLAMLAMMDVILVASVVVQKLWVGASYEKTAFTLFAVFMITVSLLLLLWLVSAPVRRILKPRQL